MAAIHEMYSEAHNSLRVEEIPQIVLHKDTKQETTYKAFKLKDSIGDSIFSIEQYEEQKCDPYYQIKLTTNVPSKVFFQNVENLFKEFEEKNIKPPYDEENLTWTVIDKRNIAHSNLKITLPISQSYAKRFSEEHTLIRLDSPYGSFVHTRAYEKPDISNIYRISIISELHAPDELTQFITKHATHQLEKRRIKNLFT